MPLQPCTTLYGDALLQIGLIVKVRIAKTSFTLDSGKFLSAKVCSYTVVHQFVVSYTVVHQFVVSGLDTYNKVTFRGRGGH